MTFDIKDSLKEHYLFDYPINDILDCFMIIFKAERKELLIKFQRNYKHLDGELNFSPTFYNISDIIVYKYFNHNLSFMEKCFIKSSKFKGQPFQLKIKNIENE